MIEENIIKEIRLNCITAQKLKFLITDFFSKSEEICNKKTHFLSSV